MSGISVGVMYFPIKSVKYTKSDLTEISNRITEKGEFVIEDYINGYKLCNHNETRAIIYKDNSIFYIPRALEETDFSSTQLKSIAKEGLDFAQENTPIKDYSKYIELQLTGNSVKTFYKFGAEKIIKNFAEELFGDYAEYKKTELANLGFLISVKSTEMPVLEIPD
ncbi:MAG: hypothetical protein KAT28_05420 [Candidatus Aenigmarchaeota archaeon]|nr:hypothetical protein [Candidatus Aenigmarchaeota archaeon]